MSAKGVAFILGSQFKAITATGHFAIVHKRVLAQSIDGSSKLSSYQLSLGRAKRFNADRPKLFSQQAVH